MFIKTKDGQTVKLKFNEPQKRLYDTIARQAKEGRPQRVIILKARQMGFSTAVESIIFSKTATNRNISSGIITHVEEATTNLFTMSKMFYNELPDVLKPQIQASNAKELIFNTPDNKGLNSKIKCMTAGSDGVGRSGTFQNLHISEYAFWKGDKKKTLTGLIQAVPNTPNSLVVIESTANGFDDFKDMWDKAVAGENDFEPLFFAWHELDEYRMPYTGFVLTEEEQDLKERYELDNEQLTWRRWCIKNNCGGDIELFKQEYPSNPHEAFISTGNTVFDKEQIIKRLEKVPQPVRQGFFEYDYDKLTITNVKWVDNPQGYIKLYELPKSGYPYVLGGDPAGEGDDYFASHVIDNTSGRQVASVRCLIDEDLYAKQMFCLGMYYNEALIGLETNFSTYPIRELQRLDYPKLYVREVEDTFTGRIHNSYGFRTTTITRPIIIADLVRIVRENIELINDKTTLEEMLTFIRTDKGKAEAEVGKHDDTVMALAITYYIRDQQSYKPNLAINSKNEEIWWLIEDEEKGDYMKW